MGAYLTLYLIRDNYIDIRFRNYFTEDDRKNDKKFTKDFFIIASVHTCLLAIFSIFNLRNTCVVLSFMKEKQLSDKVNSRSIGRLRTILRRYPIVCMSYWIFLIFYF